MSPEQILAKAISRAKYDHGIPIKQIHKSVPLKVVEKPVERFSPALLETPPKFPTVGKIVRTVAEHYGLSLADMCSIRRLKPICVPRQVAMYLARTHTPQSFPVIGRMLGGRDHTTIMHGYNKICELIGVDEKLRAEIQEIELKLGLCGGPALAD